jgi:cation transport ATPase
MVYKLTNTKMTDEEKKYVFYGQFILAFFASLYLLFFMSMMLMVMGIPDLFGLLLLTRTILLILISPIILTIIQYVYQDNVDIDNILSIGILLTTIMSALFPLRAVAPSLFKKNSLTLAIF